MNHRTAARLGLSTVALVGLFVAACGTAAPPPTRAQLRELTDVSMTASPIVSATIVHSATVVSEVLPSGQPAVTPDGFSQKTAVAPVAATLTAGPTSLSAQPRLRQLTSGGCCTQPFWSSDSRYVQFIDRPASRPLGIYGVDIERPGSRMLVSEWVVTTSGSGDFYVYPDGNTTVVQHAVTGEKHIIANGGRPVSVSPDDQHLLWQVIDRRGDFDKRRSQIYVANIDGSNSRLVGETIGPGWSEWIDSQHVLLVGLPLKNRNSVSIAALTLGEEDAGDQLSELAQVYQPQETLISPGGSWLIYLLTFQDDPNDDGLWIVPTDGSRPPRRLEFFGSFHWRDDSHLLYVPLELDVESHTLWEYDVADDASQSLTDPTLTRFRIANNDWVVSPDGRYVAFVNAADHNLWLMDLEAE
jgi:Tol biopolymer transport system component